MYLQPARALTPSARFDSGVAEVLLRLLHDAGEQVEHDLLSARACLDRATALLESERTRLEHSFLSLGAPSGRQLLAPWQVKRFTAYVNENLDRPIRIYELAHVARLTSSYFSRAFKATFGMPVQDYIAIRRMNLACVLMLTTDDSLSQIALSCGLSDQAQFSRVFSKMWGQPPGVWRRERRGAVARS